MQNIHPGRVLVPLILIVLGLALIIGAVAWIYLVPRQAAAEAGQGERIPYASIPRLSLAEARAAYDSQAAIFIDVRGEPYFSQGHIKGARSVSLDELPARLQELDPKQWIITYCT